MNFTGTMEDIILQILNNKRKEFSILVGRSDWREYTNLIYAELSNVYGREDAIVNHRNDQDTVLISSEQAMDIGAFIARGKITIWWLWITKRRSFPRPVIQIMLDDCIQWQDKRYYIRVWQDMIPKEVKST
jgi:hypothetical protein